MNVLALHVATSGLPARGVAKGDTDYPWATEIGCEMFELETGRVIGSLGTRIQANGRIVQAGATEIHGITTREAGKGGLSDISAIAPVCGFAYQCEILCGFPAGFSRDVLESQLIKLKKSTRMLVHPGMRVVDLMEACSYVTKIPLKKDGEDTGQYAWPKFDHAVEAILGDAPASFDTPHPTALEQAQKVRRLFQELVRRDLIEVRA